MYYGLASELADSYQQRRNRISGRREWNNHRQWSLDLRLLPRLAILLLKTATSLVSLVGDLGQEMGLVNRWTRGAMGHGHHPALHHLALWYRSEELETLGLWDKRWNGRESSWVRTMCFNGVGDVDPSMFC